MSAPSGGYCRHERKECALARAIYRHHAFACGECDTPRFRGCHTEAVLYGGEEAFGGNRAMRSAFRKGWNARAAGERDSSNPYGRGSAHSDRRGRYGRGFGPAFKNAWSAGWAWADHYAALSGGQVDDVESTLILATLGGVRPECFPQPKHELA